MQAQTIETICALIIVLGRSELMLKISGITDLIFQGDIFTVAAWNPFTLEV